MSNVVVEMVSDTISLVASDVFSVVQVPSSDVPVVACSIDRSAATMTSHMVMVSGLVEGMSGLECFSMGVFVDFVEAFVSSHHRGVCFPFASNESGSDLS